MELIRPSWLAPRLKKTAIFITCKKIAEAYFGRPAHYLFDHAIYKMPFNNTVTPWHQDQAYVGEKIKSLHFWIPFQDTDETKGTMQFVAGSHHGYDVHELAINGNKNLLRVKQVPTNNIRSMTFSKGDLCVHKPMTLHYTGANNSSDVRKAWIIHFGKQTACYKRWLQLKSLIAGV